MTPMRAAVAISLLLSCLRPGDARAQSGAAQATAPASQAEARFFEGQQLYDRREFAGALAAFRASYAASASPNSRLYISRCLRGLGRAAEAYEEYGRVVLEAGERLSAEPRYADTQRAASEERAALRDRVAFVTFALSAPVAGASLRVDGGAATAAALHREHTVNAGALTVRAEAPGHAPFEAVLSMYGGEKRRVVIELVPLSKAAASRATSSDAPPSSPLFPAAIVASGVGVAGLVAWGSLGSMASSRHAELAARCGGRCGSEWQADIDAGRRETTASHVGLAVGIAGIAAGASLWILGEVTAPRRTPVAVALTGTGIAVGGAL